MADKKLVVAKLKALGLNGRDAEKMAAFGIDWASLMGIFKPILLKFISDFLDNLGKANPPAPPPVFPTRTTKKK